MFRRLLIPIMLSFVAGCSGPRAAIQTDLLDIEMVRIEGGRFQMGDSFEGENDDALPVHAVDVETFYLARFETTFEQFDEYAHTVHIPVPVPDEAPRGSRAVVDVSWDEAMDFCTYIGGRLPSEVEWEYAAAGGAVKQKYAGTNDDDDIDAFASHRINSGGVSLPVGQKEPNLFGLYDMSGNVAEWVDVYYEKYPQPGSLPVYNNNNERDMRLARGGSITSEVHVTRTYWRAGTLRMVRTPSIGFRCAKYARDLE